MDIASTLSLKLTKFFIKDTWQRHPPSDAGDHSLDSYMIKATQGMWYDDYHAFDSFRSEYRAQRQKAPYLTPPTRAAWESGKLFKGMTEMKLLGGCRSSTPGFARGSSGTASR